MNWNSPSSTVSWTGDDGGVLAEGPACSAEITGQSWVRPLVLCICRHAAAAEFGLLFQITLASISGRSNNLRSTRGCTYLLILGRLGSCQAPASSGGTRLACLAPGVHRCPRLISPDGLITGCPWGCLFTHREAWAHLPGPCLQINLQAFSAQALRVAALYGRGS